MADLCSMYYIHSSSQYSQAMHIFTQEKIEICVEILVTLEAVDSNAKIETLCFNLKHIDVFVSRKLQK